ncbi:uncharacterized protein FIBRA_01351 [Fibroporia radiculosa]|uniref:DNA damage-binding protein CMR1 n=1 Tax=Fibroporia radiculosa TaxID=599839 RepID=J4G0X9_9APHY|nr:uncharacterized protein FIBRA_01351 [Fibroporia radiculosa]CCL99333.1 predicted protein [Fibroporia radiculosa]
MSDISDYELEREANIARNRELLAKLDFSVDLPSNPGKRKAQEKSSAKPVQPNKRTKREKEPVIPVRQSARLRRTTVILDESPGQRKRREKEEEELRKKEEEERLEAEEHAREAKRPRHHDLDLSVVADDLLPEDLSALRTTLQTLTQTAHPRRTASHDAFVFDTDKKEAEALTDLREKLGRLKVVARAKVTQDRVYSAAYHPDPTKDLIFFGDKHGQLGIWDARAPPDEAADEDGETSAASDGENGRHWAMQIHWPASSRSSISSIKFDPVNSHNVFTSSYDCTIRSLSFTSEISREIFSTDDVLISCIDLLPTGQEMWISDAVGGLTHLDLREDRSRARWYQVSEQKIGSVSINPRNPHFLVTASNNRAMKVWDTRRLENIPVQTLDDDLVEMKDFNQEIVEEHLSSAAGNNCLRADWRHNKSVSSAYWDPRGRSILSTSYDDTLRLWDIDSSLMARDTPFPSSRPFSHVQHNCQTGRWLTVFKAQWSPNPDCYPHFTVGNMEHSLDIFSCKGDLVTRLADRKKITAVQAVTCSHPSILERAASGNASGRCVLWAPLDL